MASTPQETSSAEPIAVRQVAPEEADLLKMKTTIVKKIKECDNTLLFYFYKKEGLEDELAKIEYALRIQGMARVRTVGQATFFVFFNVPNADNPLQQQQQATDANLTSAPTVSAPTASASTASAPPAPASRPTFISAPAVLAPITCN